MGSTVVVGCVFLTMWIGVVSAQGYSLAFSVDDMARLEDDLLTGYKVSTRPASQTNVTVSMLLANVLELNIVEQTCSISTYIISSWDDSRLEWNATDYGGVAGIYLQSDQLWKPPLYLNNAVKDFRVVGDESHQANMPVFVTSSSFVFWYAPGYFESRCDADVSNFPFDSHTCTFLISTWLYSDSTVQLSHFPTNNMINEELFEENSEWKVTSTDTSYVYRTLHNQPYRALSFSITLQRRTSYYVLYVLVPVLVFNLVGVVVFAVPPGSGEKLSFALTMLLAITVLMTIVGEKIPTSSMQVSKLGVYLVLSMVLSILEVIITVLILRLYNAGQDNMPVTKFWRIVARVFQTPWKKRNCCRSRGEKRQSVAPLVTTVHCNSLTSVESTHTNTHNIKDFKEKLDDEQEDTKQLSYKDITVKMDWLCLVVFLTFTVLMSIWFIIASAV